MTGTVPIIVGGLYRVSRVGSTDMRYVLAIAIAGAHTHSHLLTFYNPVAKAALGNMIPVVRREHQLGNMVAIVKQENLDEFFAIVYPIAPDGIAFLNRITAIEDDQFAMYADHLVDTMKSDVIKSVTGLREFIRLEMEILCKIKHDLGSQEDST